MQVLTTYHAKSFASILRGAFCLAIVAYQPLLVSADPAAPRPLLIVSESYPPYEFVANGNPTGINVEVVSTIMQRIGVPCTFRVDYPFTRAHMMLQSGHADAGLSISHAPSRESFLLYTEDQRRFSIDERLPTNRLWVTEYVFFVSARNATALKFESYEQVKRDGYRVGGLREYVYDRKFRDAQLAITYYITPADALRALDRGEIDLLPLDRTVGTWLARDAGLADRVTHLPQVVFQKPYLLVFARLSDYPDLAGVRDRFYRELLAMRNSGEFRAIINRHIPPPYPFPLPRPLLFVCENWSPFEYEQDGAVRGIDAEVVGRIMRRLNLPYEIRVYPWSRAWMMIENGRADAVLSVSYSSGREEVLHYSSTQRKAAAAQSIPPDHLWVSEYVFFVMNSKLDRLKFESYKQIKADGCRVGVNRDYTYDAAFRDADLGTHQFSTAEDGLKALIQDEIDLYPMDKTVGLAELRKLGLDKSIGYLPKPLFRKPYLAAFSRRSDIPGMEGIMADFYRELQRMRATGEYDEIVRHNGALGQTVEATP